MRPILLLFLAKLVNSVDIVIKGHEIPNLPYTAILYNTDTSKSSLDQSQAKIGKISRSHEKGKDDVNIEVLFFWDSKTKYFPFDVFTHFPSVKTLQIIKPFSEMVSPINGHFLNAEKLERIYITNQKFKAMGSNVFEGASKLQWLYLEQDFISSVDEGTFRNLRTLKKLSLQGNQIKSLPDEIFSTLSDLEYLNIKNNLLTSLAATIFKENKKLRSLFLDVNRLLFIPALELPENFDVLQLDDNLCVNEIFHNSIELQKVVEKTCTVNLSPKEVMETYKQQQQNPQNCDDKDKDKILELKEKLKSTLEEIKKLEESKENLTDVLEAVSSIEYCYIRGGM